jgi:hypothetical protein
MSRGVSQILAAQLGSINVLLRATELSLDAGYASDAALMPTGTLQVALGPFHRSVDALSPQLQNAARAHAAIPQATLKVGATDSSPGITLVLHGATYISDQVSASSSSNPGALETLQLGLNGLTVTDVGSGKTAQSQP